MGSGLEMNIFHYVSCLIETEMKFTLLLLVYTTKSKLNSSDYGVEMCD
jgi:hypothetical protein